MNPAVWTLWLIVHGAVIGSGGETPAIAPMATYSTQAECLSAINSMYDTLKKQFPTNTPAPGLMICIWGTPLKR